MIYTLTFNPSLDYVMFFETLSEGKLNRSAGEALFVGGKGVNVSIILKELGVESTALGFTAGFTGHAIQAMLTEKGIPTDFVYLEEGFSRINVKIKSGTETELNARGPYVKEYHIKLLFSKLDRLGKDDFLILAGNVPSSLPQNIYEDILEYLSQKQVNFVVDAEKNLLLGTLKYKPFLVKPNNNELEEIFETKLPSLSDIVFYARKLRDMGAQNVIVSMAKDGAVLVDNTDKIYKISVPQRKVINSVGAGDSMVAGFVAGVLQDKAYPDALKLAAACGSATAFSKDLADINKICNILGLVSDPEIVNK